MEKLWIFGDSFSVGSGLWKLTNPPPPAWTDIVAKKLNYKLVNRAKGGWSCSAIIQELCESMHKIKENDFVVIGSTHASRMDFWDWVTKYWTNITPGLADGDMQYHYKRKSDGGKSRYIAFHEKTLMGLGKGRPDLRKIMSRYFFEIRCKGDDWYHNRYNNIFIGLQKELKRRNINSILWNWYGPEVYSLTPDKKLIGKHSKHHYESLFELGIKDHHWSGKGNADFADMLIENIHNGVTHWENIYNDTK